MSESLSNPLVSVVVITYNSAKYVLDTLESAKMQTYQNIELIISDDGSQDETVKICKNWLVVNKERFTNTHLIEVKKNTGIPANCNRGVLASEGKWIKLIAGDDILLDICVEKNVEFTDKNPAANVVASRIISFNQKGKLPEKWSSKQAYFFQSNVQKQYKLYLRYPLFINPPSFFFTKAIIEKIHYFDEEFKRLEDQPFYYRLLSNGNRIFFLDKYTVKYRKHENNISANINVNLINDLHGVYLKYRAPFLTDFTDVVFKYFIRKDLKLMRAVEYNPQKNKIFYTMYRLLKNLIYV